MSFIAAEIDCQPDVWRGAAALKLREASQSWAESNPAMEFRHGPISVVDDRSAVWIFGSAPGFHLTSAQRLAVAIAERKGLDPDAPRHLARSIILDGT
jgi:glutamine---fructose-6-phosphate transaminase (isomerizing)